MATGLLLVGLVALLVLSAVYFWRVFARYALLAWYVTDGDLVREAGDLREMYRLAAVTRMRVKRTSDGRLRAIGLRFDDGRSLYVNALESPEEFLVTLRRECVVEPAEVKEPLDFDNPWFYRILGLAVGAMLSTVLRLVANIDEQSARIVYMVTGLFVVVSGTYWLYSRPIAQSYGHSKRFVDVIVGGASVLVGAVIAVVGFLWGSV